MHRRLAIAVVLLVAVVASCSSGDEDDVADPDGDATGTTAEVVDGDEPSDIGVDDGLTGAQRFEAEFGFSTTAALDYRQALVVTGAAQATSPDFSPEAAAAIGVEACDIMRATDERPADVAASGDVSLTWPDGAEMNADELLAALSNTFEVCPDALG